MEELIAYYPWLAYGEEDATLPPRRALAGAAAERRYVRVSRPRERYVRRARRAGRLESGYSFRHLLGE